MAKIILDADDKQYIFQFAFSPSGSGTTSAARTKGASKETSADGNDEAIVLDGTERYPYVEVSIYRKDRPKLRFQWAGLLSSRKTIPFEVPSPEPPPPATGTSAKKTGTPAIAAPDPPVKTDTNGCKGQFYLYQNSYTAGRFVWFDIQFGNDFEREYEGCMVEIPTTDE